MCIDPRVTEPGGYIQWIEADNSASQVLFNTPGAPAEATREVFGYYSEWCKERSYPGLLRFPELFVQSGMEIVAEESFGTSRVQYESAFHTPMMLELVGKMVLDEKVKKRVMNVKDAEYLLDRAAQETRHGDIYQHSEIWAVVGKKGVAVESASGSSESSAK